MNAEDLKDRIVSRLYAAFGDDTGALFGIHDRAAVEAIVRQTLLIEHSGARIQEEVKEKNE